MLGTERRDVYGRLLAYVHLGHLFVNAELVRRGLARTLTIPPNDLHARLFSSLEQAAGATGSGSRLALGRLREVRGARTDPRERVPQSV